MPSPMYPTVFPDVFKSLTILAFCIGESLAKIFVDFKCFFNAISDNLSIWLPTMIFSEFIPTLLHIHLVISTLSPETL